MSEYSLDKFSEEQKEIFFNLLVLSDINKNKIINMFDKSQATVYRQAQKLEKFEEEEKIDFIYQTMIDLLHTQSKQEPHAQANIQAINTEDYKVQKELIEDLKAEIRQLKIIIDTLNRWQKIILPAQEKFEHLAESFEKCADEYLQSVTKATFTGATALFARIFNDTIRNELEKEFKKYYNEMNARMDLIEKENSKHDNKKTGMVGKILGKKA